MEFKLLLLIGYRKRSGYVADIDAMACAKVSCHLGAGRTRADEPVDPAVGLEIHHELGDTIQKGLSDHVCVLFAGT